MTDQPTCYVALLRGINVGGTTRVSMAQLKLCIEALGFDAVGTYTNTGNVIFYAGDPDPRALESRIEKALATTFGYPISVVVRSFRDMQQLMQHIPSSWHTDTTQKCNVIFLRHTIDSPDLPKTLQPKPGIEELHYHPGVLFWSAHTSDLTKSTLVTLSRRPLYKEMTVRNLSTTRKIYELMEQRALQ